MATKDCPICGGWGIIWETRGAIISGGKRCANCEGKGVIPDPYKRRAHSIAWKKHCAEEERASKWPDELSQLEEQEREGKLKDDDAARLKQLRAYRDRPPHRQQEEGGT